MYWGRKEPPFGPFHFVSTTQGSFQRPTKLMVRLSFSGVQS
jgi:hypothetical protein